MSAPQSPGGDGGSHHDGDGEEPNNFILDFMQRAWLAGNENYVIQLDGGNGEADAVDDDENEDEDFHDVEEDDEEGDEDEEQEDDEEEDDDDDDYDDDFVDEGQTFPHLTRRQWNLVLQGGSIHNVLIRVPGMEEYGPDRLRRRAADPSRFPKVPSKDGRELMSSGLFGVRERPRTTTTFSSTPYHSRPVPLRLLDRELGLADTRADRWRNEKLIAQSMIPATSPDMIVRYSAPVYLGQFSDDGNFFYSASKDFQVRMYDTANVNEWQHYKTVAHPSGRWTLTDASLSPDNRWLAFTSMMPQVCLAPTDPHDEGEPYLLDLSEGADEHSQYHSYAIFSVRFSGDGRELVVGTSASTIVVYDIETRRVLHSIYGHEQDVNAVCFGDKASPHLLYSGSDDATIKVWDRRSLGDGRPAGAFVGHCEGITYIDSKGDGRYILSNGKDQTMRLWDLRMAMGTADFERNEPTRVTRDSSHDYRFEPYDDRKWFKHPFDNSVVTFRGHRVERTLIRCHFSPPGSSDGSYVYSASHDGKVYIWNLDATLAGVIDVRMATSNTIAKLIAEEGTGEGGRSASVHRRHQRSLDGPICVRDASWHPTAPVLVASGFDADSMEAGTCSVHSCAISQDGDAGGREQRLYDEKLRPMPAWEARMRVVPWFR